MMIKRTICILADVSGSMAGYKIKSVEAGICSLLEKLSTHLQDVRLFVFAEEACEILLKDAHVALPVRSESGGCKKLADCLDRCIDRDTSVAFVLYGDGIGYFTDGCPEDLFGHWAAQSAMCHCFRVGEEPEQEDDLVRLAVALSPSVEKLQFPMLDSDVSPIAYALNAFIDGSDAFE